MTEPNNSRRDFVKKGAYIAPAILTMAVAPEFAKAGSVKPEPPKTGGGGPGGAGPAPGPGGRPGNDRPGRGFGPGRVDDGPRHGGGWLGNFLRNLFGRR